MVVANRGVRRNEPLDIKFSGRIVNYKTIWFYGPNNKNRKFNLRKYV